MKRVVIVYGTRPEILKLVPLILKMREHEGDRSEDHQYWSA